MSGAWIRTSPPLVPVEAVDDTTVAFTLSEVRSAELFLPVVADIADGYVVCMEAYGAMGADEFANHPVGTGPYQFVSYSPGDRVQLTSFDEYWRGEPRMAGIELRFMADESSRELALHAGEVDFLSGIDEGHWVERMDAVDGVTAFGLPVGGSAVLPDQSDPRALRRHQGRAVMYAHKTGGAPRPRWRGGG